MSPPDVAGARQVLMGELGLTREWVRAEAAKIVENAVQKHVAKLLDQGYIDKMVRAEVERIARTNAWTANSINDLIAKSAGEVIREHVTKLLKVAL